MSVDPVVTDEKTGGHFNRYAYADNNPYRFKDPDGRSPKLVVDFALNVTLNVLTTGEFGLASAAKETLIGAINPAKTLQTATKVIGAASRYSRASYGYRSGSATAKAIREEAAGKACPKCGQEMVPGTKTAPQVQHEPPLSQVHYEGGGTGMSAAEKKTHANSEASMNGANCAQCQAKEGAAQRQYVQTQEKLKE